ncbi:CBS domain-containing protein, partial [Amycolatopsis sp. NPDC000740]
TARAVAEAVAEDHVGQVGDLAELPPLVTGDSTLADALDALGQAPGTGLPVLTGTDELTGWVTHQSVLSALEPAAASR